MSELVETDGGIGGRVISDALANQQHQQEQRLAALRRDPAAPGRAFLRPLEGKFKCGECAGLLREPVQCTSCGHRYCGQPCAAHILNTTRLCPMDLKPMGKQQVFPDKSVELEISQLQVYCKYREFGCVEIWVLLNISEHEAECEFGKVECPNKCNKKIKRSEFNAHFINCVQASLASMDPSVTQHFTTDDLRRIVIGLSISMKETEELRKLLQASQVMIARHADQIAHIKSVMGDADGQETAGDPVTIQYRLAAITEAVSTLGLESGGGGVGKRASDRQQLEVTVADQELRLTATELATYTGSAILRVTEWSRRRRDAAQGRAVSIYGAPFYTSRYGYKLKLRVYPNGDGYGKGSHLSVFLVVCRGDYDPLLKWPFSQRVTFTLLDQSNGGSNGRRHHHDSFYPDLTSASFQRPGSSGEQNVASGCPQFASHHLLEAQPGRFLRDDTIFIKVDVDPRNLPRPEDIGATAHDTY